jgi:hypothetical protein
MCVDMQILLPWVIAYEFFGRKKKEQFLGRLSSETAQ